MMRRYILFGIIVSALFPAFINAAYRPESTTSDEFYKNISDFRATILRRDSAIIWQYEALVNSFNQIISHLQIDQPTLEELGQRISDRADLLINSIDFRATIMRQDSAIIQQYEALVNSFDLVCRQLTKRNKRASWPI